MKASAGILAYKYLDDELMVFLVHPGGPFWKNKDANSWSIPKGEFVDPELPFEAAKREFEEETGFTAEGDFLPLEPVKLKSGKVVYAWAVESDVDANAINSNDFEMEWPPKSGRLQRFPEVDRAEWFSTEHALEKINAAQAGFLEQLIRLLNK
ncbi:MAG TPA: NUDIX domain-containing protein [Flavobacterium sp.]|jgi:predicted NUDIX family NTP pyrophosphohydrolase